MNTVQSIARVRKRAFPINCWPVCLMVMMIGLALLAGCSPGEATIETPTATNVPSATPEPTETPIPSPKPTNTPLPSPTPTPGPLSLAEVLEAVSSSMAYIQLPTQSGSGFLYDGGYVVTNAHVVWPYEAARVVFPDGDEFVNVPVLNMDRHRDLAILGPIESDVDALPFIDAEERIVGDDVFVVGYPGEVEEFPQPTISPGVISRVREWELSEMTYYQVDAKFGPGQSGGVLVSDRAEVVGIANFLFDESGYGLVASSADVKPHLQKLIEDEEDYKADNRRIPFTGGKKSHHFVDLYDLNQVQAFVLNEPAHTEVELEVDGGSSDLAMLVYDSIGMLVEYVDDNYSGVERYNFTKELEGPYYVNVFQYTPEPGQFSIESNRNLIPYKDFDDNRGLLKDNYFDGCIDYPGDSDNFHLTLEGGDRINIIVDSISIDPHLVFGILGAFAEDDNEGGGLFGLNPELSYHASANGTFDVIVSDASWQNTGCYRLYVREDYPGAPKPVTLETSFETFYTDVGTMWTYESRSSQLSMNVPADWIDSPSAFGDLAAFCQLAELCLASDDALLMISSEDLGILGDMTLEEYVEFYRNYVKNFNYDVVGEQAIETRSGSEGAVLELTLGDVLKITRLMIVHEGIGYNIAYVYQNELEEELRPLIDYTFNTVSVID